MTYLTDDHGQTHEFATASVAEAVKLLRHRGVMGSLRVSQVKP